MSLIELRDFDGLHTNADPTDISKRSMLVLNNMIARMGRLNKVFAPGYTGDTISLQGNHYEVKNLVHLAHRSIFGGHSNVAAQISKDSNHLYLSVEEGGNPFSDEDAASVLLFNAPYEFPEGVTFTLDSTHGVRQTGTQTVSGTLIGLSGNPLSSLYWDDFQIGIYDFADIFYNTNHPTIGLATHLDVTSAMHTSGSWSFSRILFSGVKVVRLERVNWESLILGATPSALINTATIEVGGRKGVPVPSGELEPNVTYWANGLGGTVTYNEVTYAHGETFVGVSGAEDYTATLGAEAWRSAVIGDDLWVIDADNDANGIQRVLSSSYDSGTDITTFILRDAMPSNPSGGGSLRSITAVGEAYNSRFVPRSYAVPRSTHTQQNQLFNIIGYRNFIYGHAVAICALAAHGDQANAEELLKTLLRCQYPLSNSGVHGPGVADGNFAFSYFVHGYNPGPYLEGADQVVNGGFDTDTVWSKGTGWSIPGSAGAVHTGATGALTQSSVFDARQEHAGMRARITFDVTAISGGSCTPQVGANVGTSREALGTFTESIAIDAITDDFMIYANGDITIDNVVIAIECDSILSPDPYFRTGASAWVGMALGFFIEKFPASNFADSAEQSGIYLLDHLIDAYYIGSTESDSPHYGRFRGGQGAYDFLNPDYTWHPNRLIKWISSEHNVDMWHFLAWAVELGWTSAKGHDYSAILRLLRRKLLADRGTPDWGHWWPEARRALQGGVVVYDVQGVDGQGRIVMRNDLTSIFPSGTEFTVDRTGTTIA